MKKRESLPLYFPDPMALERMRDFLNAGQFRSRPGAHLEQMDAANCNELRALMADLQRAGNNWQRFIELRLIARRPVDFVNGTFNIPSHTERPVLVPYPGKRSAHQQAYGAFLQFILHPEFDRLNGPCRSKKCGRFFLRESSHQKVYCTSRCASLETAVIAMQRKRLAQKELKKRAVEAAIVKYKRNRQRSDWRLYVESETGVTKRTLEGWVKTGFIEAPSGRQRGK